MVLVTVASTLPMLSICLFLSLVLTTTSATLTCLTGNYSIKLFLALRFALARLTAPVLNASNRVEGSPLHEVPGHELRYIGKPESEYKIRKYSLPLFFQPYILSTYPPLHILVRVQSPCIRGLCSVHHSPCIARSCQIYATCTHSLSSP